MTTAICFDGEDLLILAGPTMTLDAPLYVFRLKIPLDLAENSFYSQINGQLSKIIEIPHGIQCDRAEGISLYPSPHGAKTLPVVYDLPSESKDGKIGHKTENPILVDLFEI